MADAKVSTLTEISVPDLADYDYAVDASGPTSARITYTRLGGLLVPAMATGRLTLTTGNAAPTADVTSGATIYYTDIHNDGTVTASPFQISVFDGTRLRMYSSAQISLSLTGLLTNARPHDIFIYDNAGTLTLEVLAWTSDTARATALAAQSGTLVKTGATTRRYVGTIYATGTGTTDDSLANRYVWNAYNRIERPLIVRETTSSWTYNSSTIRQMRASSANQVNVVVGLPGCSVVDLMAAVTVSGAAAASTGHIGIGEDSTTIEISAAHLAVYPAFDNASTGVVIGGPWAKVKKFTAIGKHYYAALEASATNGQVATFYGNSGGGNMIGTGIAGSIAA